MPEWVHPTREARDVGTTISRASFEPFQVHGGAPHSRRFLLCHSV